MITTSLDIAGALLGFLCTIFYVRASIWAWPVGLAGLVLDIILYWKTGIYGDVSLNVVYLIMTFYGWWQWKYGGESKTQLPISNLTGKTAIVLAAIGFIGLLLFAECLRFFTDSQIPWWDATTTVLSLIAQLLICRKIVQCWILWFVVDSLFIGIYLYKGIPVHALLNFIYLGMAVYGYFHWRQFLEIKTEVQDGKTFSVGS